jgi:hypothetical protein
VIIVSFGRAKTLETAFKNFGIPTVSLTPEALKESALVAQSIRNAMVGELAIIDEIMEMPLPTLPKWYNTIKAERKVVTPAESA